MSRTPARFTQADIARAGKEGKVFIYFVQAGGFIKIGKTRRWKARIATMQTGSPYVIVPILVLVDSPFLEGKLHFRFRQSHHRGEWFHSGPAISAFVKEHLHLCVTKVEGDNSFIAGPTWEDREIVL